MAINGITGSTSFFIQQLVNSRDKLDDLQRQLGSGLKSQTYRGLGQDVSTDVAFRQQISVLEGYQQTISRVSIRLDIVDTTLNQVDEVVREARGAIDPNTFVVLGQNKTLAQQSAENALGEVLSVLNTKADGRYVFSGRDVQQKPLAELGAILDGKGALAGLRQVVNERQQADLGAGGLGRLTVGTVTDTVTFAEDGAHPFGFKIEDIQNGLSNVAVVSTVGPPRSEAIQFTGLPGAGESFTVEALLPDGSREQITLTASSETAVEGTFQIGADPDATAANFDAALNVALAAAAATALDAASAVQAGNDFFNTENGAAPQRVDGPPFDSATALRDGTADTVTFYLGENLADNPRRTSSARVDSSLVVDYGARANEEPLSQAIRSLAVFAVETFSETNPQDRQRYQELSSRVRQTLAFPSGAESINQMHVEIVGVSQAVESARQRHVSAIGMLTQTVEDIEGINLEEVSAEIITLQTRLQASYQTTAILNKLTLTNFI